MNNEGLVVSLVTFEPAWREKNPGPNVSRKIKFVSGGARSARASALGQLGDQPAVGMFTIGNVKVIPNVSGSYHRGSPVGVYMQIYNAGVDQTTLRPSVDVEYALMKDGKEVGKQLEDWRGNSDSGQRLTLARLLDSRNLVPGDYALEVRVKDRVSGQALVQSAKFTILP